MELLHLWAASDDGYLELESNDCLKSRMQENCTSGSVRGSRQAFHFKYNERSVETVFAALLFLSFSGMLSTNLRRACDQPHLAQLFTVFCCSVKVSRLVAYDKECAECSDPLIADLS